MSDEVLNTEPHMEANMIEADPMSTMKCAFCNAEINIEGLPRFSPVACQSCGKENNVSAKLGHFVLLKQLGSGGMGTVFLAEDENLGRKVAIKVMQKQLGQDPALFETFRNEAQSAARLNHPHVAQIYSFGREKGLPYLAMELVNGNKLDGLIESGTVLDPAFVLRVGLEIAEGLKAAEEVGLFHGDIKPENILFDENMQAKLVDFGIASMASQGASAELWGTPYYIAPEKVQKKKNSARSDIYSLGATLYHAIAGQPPYDGPDAIAVIKARFNAPPPALESIRPDVEPDVSRIIGRMMYNDLFMRYPNYGSLINDIKAYLANIPESRKVGPGKRSTIRVAVAETQNNNIAIEPAAPTASRKSGKKFVITKGALSSTPTSSIPKVIVPTANVANDPTTGQPAVIVQQPKAPNPKKAKTIILSILGAVIILILVVIGLILNVILQTGNEKKEIQRVSAEIVEIEGSYDNLVVQIDEKMKQLEQRNVEFEKVLENVAKVYSEAAEIQPIFPDFNPPKPEPEVIEDSAEDAAALSSGDEEMEDVAPSKHPLSGVTTETLTGKLASDYPELAALIAENILTQKAKLDARRYFLDSTNEEPTEEQIIKRAIEKVGKDLPEKLAELDATTQEEINAMIRSIAGDSVEENADEASDEAMVAATEEAIEEEASPSSEEDEETAKVRADLDECANDNIYVYIKEYKALLQESTLIAEKASEFDISGSKPQNPGLQTLKKIHAERYEIQTQLNETLDALTQAIKDADKYLRNARSGVKKLEKRASGFIAKRKRLAEQARLEQEAAEREAKEAEKEAKRQEAIRAEIARINSVLEGKKHLIDRFDYQQVIVEMSRMEGELIHRESLDELDFIKQRFEKLIEFRDFLLDDINKHQGLRYGYRKYDITGVSSDRTKLLVRPSKEIPISSLTFLDWKTLLWYQLYKRDRARPISFDVEAEQLFNAAIFLYVHDYGNTTSEQVMRECLERAFQKKKSLAIDAIRFIPILTQEEIDAMTQEEKDAISNGSSDGAYSDDF